MMFIYKTAKFAPVLTTIPKICATFVHENLTEHVLFEVLLFFNHVSDFRRSGIVISFERVKLDPRNCVIKILFNLNFSENEKFELSS